MSGLAAVSSTEPLHIKGTETLDATHHFTFDLTGALGEQLDAALPALTPVPLSMGNLPTVSSIPGIYQLYRGEELVYIGKADSDLRGRLTDHCRKIAGRLNISVAEIRFTGLYLEGTWIPVGPEQILIKKRENEGVRPPWNYNGFGMNDPGSERDTTNFKPDHFDVLYPADLDYVIGSIPPDSYFVCDLLPILKRQLPYVFRYENQWAKHADYLATRITLGSNPKAIDVFNALISALPNGWQVTALPGYVIMYKKVRTYPSARRTITR